MRTYVIQCLETKRVKIGQTKGDPQDRLDALQTGSPTQLRLIAELGIGEPEAHFIVRKSRLHGEWFSWTPEVACLVDAARVDNEFIVRTTIPCRECGYEKSRQTCPSCAEMRRYIPAAGDHAAYMFRAYGIGDAA